MRKREGARDREGQKEIESLREGGREREKIYNVGGFLQKIPSLLAERVLISALMWDFDGDTLLPAKRLSQFPAKILSQLSAKVQKLLYLKREKERERER